MTEAFSPSAGHDLWQNCVDHLAQELPEQQFNTWIKPLVVEVNKDHSKVTIQVGNRFKLDWVRAQYASRIVALLEKVTGQSITLELALLRGKTLPNQLLFLKTLKFWVRLSLPGWCLERIFLTRPLKTVSTPR